jgi:HEAT repeat protein
MPRCSITMLLLAVALMAFAGCGSTPTTTADGKPVAYWVEALQNRDVRVRKHAVDKLGNVGPADPAAIPALIGAVKDRDPVIRREAVLALLKNAAAAGEAGAVLNEAQKDPDAKVRAYAAQALAKIQQGEK